MSPTQTLSGSATSNCRSSRLGAIGRSCLLSVVTFKRRLPLARMPCSCMSLRTRSLPTPMPLPTRSFPLAPDAVQLHELAPPLLAHPDPPGQQFLPRARPAVAAPRFGVDHLDVHQQRVVAEMVPLGRAGSTNEVFVVAGDAGLQDPTLHRDRPRLAVAVNEGVLQLCAFAKYAVAFPRMSRSIFTRASSARSRLISICSALTALLSAPVSLPRRSALTQLNSVCSTTPSVLAVVTMLWPP